MTDPAGEPLRAHSIAIIGMAGRFPGAPDLERFWSNLTQGVESIAFFSDEEMLLSGVDPELLDRPEFVKAAPVLEDVDRFDAAFFKIARREAEMMDPQQRILLELAWETLERGGYADESPRRLVGVFAGAGGLMSSYLLSPHHLSRSLIAGTGSMQCVGNDKDYLATRISYKLNLRGPSLTVQSACSTSLVAVHLACQSLLAGECDMALAGGVTVRVPHRMGYLHSAQALLSPDGHCRAFDANAQGTLFGSGAGLVLLKPLPDAVRDGDHIHGVIRGSAVNNDGAAKLSYWAASADGQAAAAADALAVAEVEPDTIGYVETHGTATSMGDPVEIAALTRAFRRPGQPKQFCAIGSVKTNIGHLEAAAGVAGLIKAVLSLEHKLIPPSLHFVNPNPAIDFANTPFFVNTQCRSWQAGGGPRRAAVNSLGIGGTNAHLILEESPPVAPAAVKDRPLHLLTLSAKTPPALRELAERFARHLGEHPEANFADVCFSANAGRGCFRHRLALTAPSGQQARIGLEAWLGATTNLRSAPGLSSSARGAPNTAGQASSGTSACVQGNVESPGGQVVFLFPGQDAQYAGMGRELYEAQPAFRKAIDQCDAALRNSLDRPLCALLYSPGQDALLAQTVYAEPALFSLQYALVQLWKQWGVEPSAVLGHGVGEYAAACAAGVFTVEEALFLVAARARLAQSVCGAGRMAALMAPPDKLAAALGTLGNDVFLAAVNSPRQAVISGPAEAVEKLLARFDREKLRTRRLAVDSAFHCPAMGNIADEFAKACGKVNFLPPRVRIISGLTGAAVKEEIAQADYWRRHLTEPIHFADGVAMLDEQGYGVFLEIGPEPRLLGLGRRSMRNWAGLWLPSLRRGRSAWDTLFTSLARLFAHGVKIDWLGFDRGFCRRRVLLPTYPFQRQRFWIADETEDGRKASRGARLLRLLEEGKVDKIVEELKAGENDLSEEEVRLLPRILQLLAERTSSGVKAGTTRVASSRPPRPPGDGQG